ncbi:hypothetical protein ACEZCY_15070 [Streptacidiphilus sp. N1-12]|uniref:DUF5666 domain-containing protein n=2 Tax=Streptacidiphilus alkalitolerans TaxID=3342712 RepID=A0ABV6VA29_9ACTN
MAGRHSEAATTELVKAGNPQLPDVYGPGPEEILAEAPDARDIAAELAAPPRRKLPWLRLLLVAGMVAGAAFAGGAYYQKNNGTSSAGGLPTGTRPSGFAGFGGAGGTGGAATGDSTSGTVKLVDGDTLYLTTSSGSVVKVTTKGTTKITTAKTGTTADLLPGQTVTVEGSTDSSGNVAATTVTQGG